LSWDGGVFLQQALQALEAGEVVHIESIRQLDDLQLQAGGDVQGSAQHL
jgi:hypothetical protein